MESVNQKERKRIKSCPQEEDHESATGLDDLPRDIALDILSRLPASSLMQFKSVCRAWRNLSRDPRLPRSHLSLAVKNPCLIIHCDSPIRNQLYFVDNDDRLGYSEVVTKVDTPFKSVMPEFDIVGSCNGLLCLSDSLYCDPLYVSNPFTGTHIELPRTTQFKNQEVVFGFGFHPTTEQYKVVRIVYYRSPCTGLTGGRGGYLQSLVQIFTLGTDAWRRIGHSRFQLRGRPTEAMVNGALHWVSPKGRVRPIRSRVIISFDLAEEKFKEIPRPDCGSLDKRNYHLVVLGGCLSAAVYQNDGQIDIWVMKEYSVKESWTRDFTIGAYVPSGLNPEVIRPNTIWKNVLNGQLVRVLCLLKNGEILLEYKCKALVSYNTESEEFKDFTIQGLPKRFQTVIHVGSLISAEVAIEMQR